MIGASLVTLLLVGSALAQNEITLCEWEKDNVEECKALPGYFKCGVFMAGIPSREQIYLESIPDVLKRPEYSAEKAAKSAFKNVQEKDFYLGDPAEKCNDKVDALANSRCYLTLFDIGDIFLDNCETNLVSDGSDDIMGNQLCQLMEKRGYVDSTVQSIREADLNFMYSVCEGDWKVVNSKGDPFKVKEKLCCKRDPTDNLLKFERCDGTPFNTQCNGEGSR